MLFQVVILLPILVHTLLASQLYEHAEINFACPCFVDFTTQYYAGLGHRMMEYTIGLHIAYDVGCTFITHSRMLESHGLHGNYSDIASLLGVFEGDLLDNDEQRYAHLIRTKKQPDYPFTRDPNECHVLYELQQQSCPSGNERYCFQVPHIIEDVAWLLRAKAAPALQHVCGAHQLDAEQHIAPSTVFHLRVGDIVIDHGATYYQNLLAEVARAAPGSDVLVLHSCPSCRPGTLHSQFSGIFPASCAKLGLRCRFAAHLTVYDSLAAMACADLLVTSGSMFSILASLVTRAAVIFVDNKDEACPQCCSQPHFAFPANDGTLVPLERAKLKAQLTVGHADGTRRFLVPDHLLPVEPTQQSYAQCGQDFIIDKLFSDRPREEPRFYVDLAANHPLILSNTYLLDRKRGCVAACVPKFIRSSQLAWLVHRSQSQLLVSADDAPHVHSSGRCHRRRLARSSLSFRWGDGRHCWRRFRQQASRRRCGG